MLLHALISPYLYVVTCIIFILFNSATLLYLYIYTIMCPIPITCIIFILLNSLYFHIYTIMHLMYDIFSFCFMTPLYFVYITCL